VSGQALGAPAPAAFSAREIAIAIVGAACVELGLFALFLYAGVGGHIQAKEPEPPPPIPIKVKPVLDEVPLLKLGGKKMKPKLPEMWKKNPPVQRREERSAPSEKAAKTPDAIPTSKLAPLDAEAPPPDAEVAKEVDQELLDATPDAEPTVEGEGSPDGIKEGTEADPLKARAVSQYRMKIIGWFNARFVPPSEGAPCEELKKLSAGVVATIGGDRSVTGFSIGRPSGNAIFDQRVQSSMQSTVGQILPPPPPLYPDILSSSVSLTLSGQSLQCE
jgi:hypothetical protein